jgi:hypothetical protein
MLELTDERLRELRDVASQEYEHTQDSMAGDVEAALCELLARREADRTQEPDCARWRKRAAARGKALEWLHSRLNLSFETWALDLLFDFYGNLATLAEVEDPALLQDPQEGD